MQSSQKPSTTDNQYMSATTLSVTVDDEPLNAAALGLQTVGQVLSHIQRNKRLVVQLLIDGQSPNASELPALSQTPLAGRIIFLETTDPRRLALEVLDESSEQVQSAEGSKSEAAALLQAGQNSRALQQLGSCLRIWQDAQAAVVKIAELLRIDLTRLTLKERPIETMLAKFSAQLREIKSALEQRDFVSLGDCLAYQMCETTESWLAALDAVRQAVVAS